jgi:hypothetical protein
MPETTWPLAEWLEMLPSSIWVRESLYGFAIVVGVHILSLTVSVGTIVWFDLRLVGMTLVRVPVSVLYRRVMPWTFVGFASMFASGGILFAAYATAALENPYFKIKMAALILAGLNAGVYHLVTEREIAEWDAASRPPTAARTAGLASIMLWTIVILAGRMMSYTMF